MTSLPVRKFYFCTGNDSEETFIFLSPYPERGYADE